MPDSRREKSLAGGVNISHDQRSPLHSDARSGSLRGLSRISGRSLTRVDVLASPPLSDVSHALLVAASATDGESIQSWRV